MESFVFLGGQEEEEEELIIMGLLLPFGHNDDYCNGLCSQIGAETEKGTNIRLAHNFQFGKKNLHFSLSRISLFANAFLPRFFQTYSTIVQYDTIFDQYLREILGSLFAMYPQHCAEMVDSASKGILTPASGTVKEWTKKKKRQTKSICI